MEEDDWADFQTAEPSAFTTVSAIAPAAAASTNTGLATATAATTTATATAASAEAEEWGSFEDSTTAMDHSSNNNNTASSTFNNDQTATTATIMEHAANHAAGIDRPPTTAAAAATAPSGMGATADDVASENESPDDFPALDLDDVLGDLDDDLPPVSGEGDEEDNVVDGGCAAAPATTEGIGAADAKPADFASGRGFQTKASPKQASTAAASFSSSPSPSSAANNAQRSVQQTQQTMPTTAMAKLADASTLSAGGALSINELQRSIQRLKSEKSELESRNDRLSSQLATQERTHATLLQLKTKELEQLRSSSDTALKAVIDEGGAARARDLEEHRIVLAREVCKVHDSLLETQQTIVQRVIDTLKETRGEAVDLVKEAIAAATKDNADKTIELLKEEHAKLNELEEERIKEAVVNATKICEAEVKAIGVKSQEQFAKAVEDALEEERCVAAARLESAVTAVREESAMQLAEQAKVLQKQIQDWMQEQAGELTKRAEEARKIAEGEAAKMEAVMEEVATSVRERVTQLLEADFAQRQSSQSGALLGIQHLVEAVQHSLKAVVNEGAPPSSDQCK